MEDRYASYTSVQLAGEDSFIHWVLHDDMKEQWTRWLEKHPHLLPKTVEARHIVLSLTQTSDHSFTASDQSQLWNRIKGSILAEKQIQKPATILGMWKRSVAVAATLALFFWVTNLLSPDTVKTFAGEQKELQLPEGSHVKLNAGSSIVYHQGSFEKERELSLEGEAFFSVKPGSTFTIKTEHGNVTVVGTSFNVVSRQGRYEVSCYTGKVKVENKGKDQKLINIGERTIQNQSDLSLNTFTFTPAASGPEWTTGKFTFESQPLSIVMDELERQYDVRVKLQPGLEDLTYTGLFESGDLDKALSLITWPLHLKAEIKGKTITISR